LPGVRGFLDYAGPTVHSRLAWLPCCLSPTRNEVGILIYGLFAAQSPRPPMPLSTLQETSHDVPCKTRGQDGFATSFPVGFLHPLQHAGLSRRSPVCPLFAHNPGEAPLKLPIMQEWKRLVRPNHYGFSAAWKTIGSQLRRLFPGGNQLALLSV
jgi:hypothetical protein